MELHCPENIKIHFAACETMNLYQAVKNNINYSLYTCFPFVERMCFEKAFSPIMPLRWMKNPKKDIPQYIISNSKHTIQDSGLFTLMFGSRANKDNKNLIYKWYDKMIEFTLENGAGATCVELDAQKIIGAEETWFFRERMRKDLPNNRIINVFHIEDGQKGLDKLIEYSDFIAIGVPELRVLKKQYQTPQLARYIKSKKKDIDIHLLGCTEKAILTQCKFCTSSDSTSYISGIRYGFLENKHIKNIDTKKVQELVGLDEWNMVREYNNERNTNFLCLSVYLHKKKYEQWCESQD